MTTTSIRYSSKSILLELTKDEGILIVIYSLYQKNRKLDVVRSFVKFFERCVQTFDHISMQNSKNSTLLFIGSGIKLRDNIPESKNRLYREISVIVESLLPKEIIMRTHSGYSFKGKVDRRENIVSVDQEKMGIFSYFGKEIYNKVLDLGKLEISPLRKETALALTRLDGTKLNVTVSRTKKGRQSVSLAIEIESTSARKLESIQDNILAIMKNSPAIVGKVEIESPKKYMKHPLRGALGLLTIKGKLKNAMVLVEGLSYTFPRERKQPQSTGEKLFTAIQRDDLPDQKPEEKNSGNSDLVSEFEKFGWEVKNNEGIEAVFNDFRVKISKSFE